MLKHPILIALSLATALLGACDRRDAATEATNRLTLRIGATGLSFPNAYKKDGQLTGFDVAVAEAVAQQLDARIEWVTADFSGLMGQLEAGKLDTVANAVSITPAREATYRFSTPYSYAGSQIVVRRDNATIRTLDDLRGKTVAGVLGSNHLRNLRQAFGENGVTIRTYESRDGALSDLLNRRIDGYVNAGPVLRAEITAKKLPLKFVGAPLVQEAIGFPFHHNAHGDQLRAEFDQALDVLRKTGRLQALSEHYFGADITTPPTETASAADQG